jgi:hypothetical protein
MVAGRTSAPTTTGSSVAAIVGLKKELIDLRGRTGAGKISQHGNFRGIN